METKIEEKKVLIANRVPPGDKWRLADEPNGEVHLNLTDTLEAYMAKTGFKGHYRLEPLEGKLYIIETNEIEIPDEEPMKFDLYGEY